MQPSIGEVQSRDLLGQAIEVAFGDVVRVLAALLVVEELHEVPHFVLLARRQGRDLLFLEDRRFRAGALERVIFELELPLVARIP